MLPLLTLGIALLALEPQSAASSAPAASFAARTDTTVAVRKGDRLDLWNQTGGVVIRAGDRDVVQIVARHSARSHLKVERNGARLNVATGTGLREADSVLLEVTVPAWLPVTVQGSGTSIATEGALDELTLKSQTGDVTVKGPAGMVTISAVGGAVRVDGARKRVQIGAGQKPVHVSRVAGMLSIAGVDNDITLDRIESSVVDVRTVSGRVTFDGHMARAGRYHLSSQRGDVTAVVPAATEATVSVATYVGRFVTNFPHLARTVVPKQRFTVLLGPGGAQVSLEAFAGTVTLRRGS